MDKKELWVQNPGGSDVSLSDLGVKVPAGKTVNVYRYNPYLTEAKVSESLESGALSKRLANGLLKLVKKGVKTRPQMLDQIKESKEMLKAKKTKSSVVIEPTTDPSEEGENFEFADYGLGEISPAVSQQKDGAAVVVTAKQDEEPESVEETVLEAKQSVSMSKQAQIVMDTAAKSTNPYDSVAEDRATNKPYVVPTPEPEVPVAKEEIKLTPKVTKGPTGEITVGDPVKPRSLKAVKGGKEDTSTEVLDYDADGADKVINLDNTESGMKVASKSEGGAIVMELSEGEEVADKKEATKKKPVAKKKRPTSKKK